MKAAGQFEVDLQPLPPAVAGQDGVQLGRLAVRKVFSGDLQGQSQGEMLSASSPVPDSAGYVLIEQVTGSLHGKNGSFVLQHYGLAAPGQYRLVVEIVPNSGTGDLQTIAGTFTIRIEGGQHYYELDYTLGAV